MVADKRVNKQQQGNSSMNSNKTSTQPIDTTEQVVLKETDRKEEMTKKMIQLFQSGIVDINENIRNDYMKVWEEFGFSEQQVSQLLHLTDRQLILTILSTLLQKIKNTKSVLNEKIDPSFKETPKKVKDLDVSEFFDKTVFEGKLKTDSKEALSYVTPFRQARDVSCHVLKLFKTLFKYYPVNIYDATGGIGGNTFGILDELRKVRVGRRVMVKSVEMDSNRFSCLNHNLNVYCKEYSERGEMDMISYEALEGNFLELWKDFPEKERRKSLVIIDAPWGNSDYSKHAIIYDLYLFDDGKQKSINDLSREMIYDFNVSMVVLKVPIHYSELNLVSNNEKPLEVESYFLKKSKYLILYNPSQWL